MRPDYRIQNLFGIELPIVQAPMAGVAFSEMVVGVCEAGGLGSLACGLLTPQQIAQEVEIIRRQTSRPINLNFLCHQPPTADAEPEAAWRRVLEGGFPNPKLGAIEGPLWIAPQSLDAALQEELMATMRTIESESTLVGASPILWALQESQQTESRSEIVFMLPPVYILIEDNPNCSSLDGLVFQPKAPPRQVKRVRVARDGQPVSSDVVAVNEGWATEPAMASPIDDSGDGACDAELFEPAQKIEQLLRDGFMQGSSPGVAAAYSDARGKYMLFKSCSTGGKIDGH